MIRVQSALAIFIMCELLDQINDNMGNELYKMKKDINGAIKAWVSKFFF